MLNEGFTEVFFAEAVVLVEGVTDKAVIEEVTMKEDALERYGVTVVNADGKANLILKQLGMFAPDRGNPDRLRAKGKEAAAQGEHQKDADLNRALMEHRNVLNGTDYPKGRLGSTLFAWDDNLEHTLEST